jgi:hypothetical protein
MRHALRNPAQAHEQRGQTEHEAIERGQIGRALPGSITDRKLILEQKRFRGDRAYTTCAEQRCERDEQVDGQDAQISHGASRSMATVPRKTAPHRRMRSYQEFATHTVRPLAGKRSHSLAQV